ncbi:MAG: hypothetical protein DMG97_21435 [Acidobacteria bacterium]|nr:MAG: hypothetical protein DMG97_21435 [Acidobacteriota bacterium]
MKTIRFTREDLDLFSSASHDRNPLHLSDDYAYRTPYGERVVFGVLDGLTALGSAADRPACGLSSVEFEFFDTALLGVNYSVEATESDLPESTVRVLDGRRPVLEAVLSFRAGTPRQSWQAAEWQPTLSEPEDLSSAQLMAGQRVRGSYAPSLRHLEIFCSQAQLKQTWLTHPHVAALMWASYLVGMELPGKRALFSRLRIEFQDSPRTVAPFDYEAEITEISDLGELTIHAILRSGGMAWATAKIGAHVRDDLPQVTMASVESLVGRSQVLAGKVALVTGASRGLGAAMVRVLALHGATVVLNFMCSQDQAEQLRDSLAQTAGKIILERGDAGSLEWCKDGAKRIAAQFARLDFLLCNASPTLLPLWLEASAAERVNSFVQRSLAMVSAPMMVFLPMLAAGNGWNVLVSSSAVTQPHSHFPHYVVGKSAAEALVRAASTEYRSVSSLIIRPTRLLTDLTNTPFGRRGSLPPECVAASLLKRLLGPPCPGKVEVLDRFSPLTDDSR